jgi:hypothetical protein
VDKWRILREAKRKKAKPTARAAIRLNFEITIPIERRNNVSRIKKAYDTRKVEDIRRAIAALVGIEGCISDFEGFIRFKCNSSSVNNDIFYSG